MHPAPGASGSVNNQRVVRFICPWILGALRVDAQHLLRNLTNCTAHGRHRCGRDFKLRDCEAAGPARVLHYPCNLKVMFARTLYLSKA